MNKNNNVRPPLESLACVRPECDLYGEMGQDNLSVRKVYGADEIRYLRCRVCQNEFSERYGTALFNRKIREEKVIAIAEHLSEGCSLKSTARLTKVDPSTVKRVSHAIGDHARAFHDEYVQDVVVDSIQADERWGFVANKSNKMWEAEVIDPASKFVLSHVQGKRNKALIRALLTDCTARLFNRHDVVLFTDGYASYATLFKELFGVPYRRSRNGRMGKVHYRIPRSLSHVQIMKEYSGYCLKQIRIVYRHGTQKRVQDALLNLNYAVPNTSAIERRNLTARSMSAAQKRKALSVARHERTKLALGWWSLTVANWCRTHRMLKQRLKRPTDKKSMSTAHLRWLSI